MGHRKWLVAEFPIEPKGQRKSARQNSQFNSSTHFCQNYVFRVLTNKNAALVRDTTRTKGALSIVPVGDE